MSFFKCIDERHVLCEIEIMKWNPKMDLIVLALSSGDVVLHRLVGWQKVWHLAAYKLANSEIAEVEMAEAAKIIALDWRPDGRVLAIAYLADLTNQVINKTNSSIVLHDVETSELIHVITVNSFVKFLCWEERRGFMTDDAFKTHSDEVLQVPDCIPKAKAVPKRYPRSGNAVFGLRKVTEDNADDLMKITKQETLNILASGSQSGQIELYAFGVYKIISINIGVPIHYLLLSSDLGFLSVLTSTSHVANTKYSLLNFKLDTLKNCSTQIRLIAQIYAQVVSLLYYLNECVSAISEAWEDVLVEIDSKLSNYQNLSKESSPGLMADEFLELLVLGTASDSLEKFLCELKEKGLKKLGHSIEIAYTNIQKLLVKNVQRICQHLYSYLNTLKGMALWESQFSEVGLDVKPVIAALRSVGSFLLKSTELQQVIDNSMRNVKAFFRWLYTAMTRLFNSEPAVQSEVAKISQQDLQLVAEFIKENFESHVPHTTLETEGKSRPTASNFTLDRVGQYLRNQNLNCTNSSINNLSSNPWIQYLNEKSFLTAERNDGVLLLHSHNVDASFIQEHKNCAKLAREAFSSTFNVLSTSVQDSGFTSKYEELICLPNEETVKIHHISDIANGYLFICYLNEIKPAEHLHLMRSNFNHMTSADVISLKFFISTNASTSLRILDFQFYTTEIISLLLVDTVENQFYLMQFQIKHIQDKLRSIERNEDISSPAINCHTIYLDNPELNLNYRLLDNMKSSMFAVSGTRKVTCVAFSSKRRVRLFDMDVSEEDEDEELTEASCEQEAMESSV